MPNTYIAHIDVMLRDKILDVQGKTVERSLHSLGFDTVSHVRVGKHIVMTIQAESPEAAENSARDTCKKLIANPVMEDFTVTITEMEPA